MQQQTVAVGNTKMVAQIEQGQYDDLVNLFGQRLATLKYYFPKINPKSDFEAIRNNQESLPNGFSFFPCFYWRQISDSYEGAMNLAIDALINSRKDKKFQSLFGRKFSPANLHKEIESVRNMTSIYDKQVGFGFKYVAVQADGRYSGVSVEEMKESKDKRPNEFPLDIFTVVLVLLAEPDLLSSYNDKGIICAGNRLSLSGDNNYNKVPVFKVDASGELVLDAVLAKRGSEFHSTATGFILK